MERFGWRGVNIFAEGADCGRILAGSSLAARGWLAEFACSVVW